MLVEEHWVGESPFGVGFFVVPHGVCFLDAVDDVDSTYDGVGFHLVEFGKVAEVDGVEDCGYPFVGFVE